MTNQQKTNKNNEPSSSFGWQIFFVLLSIVILVGVVIASMIGLSLPKDSRLWLHIIVSLIASVIFKFGGGKVDVNGEIKFGPISMEYSTVGSIAALLVTLLVLRIVDNYEVPPPLPPVTPTTTPATNKIDFSDNFDKTIDNRWQQEVCRWETIDGVARPAPGYGGCTLIIGDESWKDYVMSLDFRYPVTELCGFGIHFAMRKQDDIWISPFINLLGDGSTTLSETYTEESNGKLSTSYKNYFSATPNAYDTEQQNHIQIIVQDHAVTVNINAKKIYDKEELPALDIKTWSDFSGPIGLTGCGTTGFSIDNFVVKSLK